MGTATDRARAWPVAKQGVAAAIRHPAWEVARNAILDRAAAGPATVLLVGQSGAGKSWLLRELAGSLGDHGFPTTLLLQSDLPITLGEGGALLVDDALGMGDEPLRTLLQQQIGFVVLADSEALADRAAALGSEPVVVRLGPLRDRDVAWFTAAWFGRAGMPGAGLDAGAVATLAALGDGSVQTVARALKTAAEQMKATGLSSLSTVEMERIFAFRRPLRPAPAMPTPRPAPIEPTSPAVPSTPPRRQRTRAAVTALALAACVVLVWYVRPSNPPAASPALVARPGATSLESALPPLRPADRPTPMALTNVPPEPATIAGAPLSPVTPSPQVVTAAPPAVSDAPIPPVAAAADLAPLAPPLPAPTALAERPPDPIPQPPRTAAALTTPSEPARARPEPSAAASATAGREGGAPGMILLAQPGATLETMYRAVYRDRSAPPFKEVLAANPRPLKPGSIVVFPAPPGGWVASQR